MKKKTKILLGVLVLLIAMQFYRPFHNKGTADSPNYISHVVATPAPVQTLLQRACNDCHSNHTDYPWYTNIQPLGWWLQHHVDEGKEHLNLSEVGTMSLKKQAHKLEEVVEMINEDEMPLSSYTLIHADAKLSESDKQLLINWAQTARKQLLSTSSLTP